MNECFILVTTDVREDARLSEKSFMVTKQPVFPHLKKMLGKGDRGDAGGFIW